LRLEIERFRFSLIKRNTKQKNFLFLLKEKMGGEKIKKCRPACRQAGKIYLFWFRRSEAEASGNVPIYSGFSSKKVRTSSKKHRHF